MNKKEAADFLGISTRLVSRYVSQGRLKCTYVRGRTGREATYEQSDLERLKNELEEPVHRAEMTSLEPSNGTSIPAVREHVITALASLIQKQIELPKGRPEMPLENKPLLTFKEAQIYTGLSEEILNDAVEAGKLKAEKVGYARRVKRSAIDAYIEQNF
jgi:excisionase family DNA binding protein